MPTWDDVVEIGQRFPDVEVGTSFGTPAMKVRNKGMICRLRTNPDALVMRVIDLADREALLKGRPDVYFSTPHYDGYPYVLIRLDVVDRVELAELIEDAWRLRAPKRMIAAHDAAQQP
ncbi:MAG: MmcQ/YjbR family DNA-binding protein [Candidatus Rokuibacteriota bacterium]